MAPDQPTGRFGGRRRTAALVAAGLAAVGVAAGAVALLDRDAAEGTPGAAPPPSSSASPTTPSASPSPSPTPSPTPTTAPKERAAGTEPAVRRLRAADRHALSVAATRASIRSGTDVPVVYLVADDALELGWAAVPAAAARGGAVLLTRGDRLPSGTAAELERLAPAEIVLVGDAGAVATRVATAAAEVAPVVRVDTDDPVAAARALTRAAFPAASAAWVVGTDSATDLAVGAAAAAARRSPLVVVDADARSLPAADLDLLTDLGVRSATVVGGRQAVGKGVETGLTEALGVKAVRRAEAGDRGRPGRAGAHPLVGQVDRGRGLRRERRPRDRHVHGGVPRRPSPRPPLLDAHLLPARTDPRRRPRRHGRPGHRPRRGAVGPQPRRRPHGVPQHRGPVEHVGARQQAQRPVAAVVPAVRPRGPGDGALRRSRAAGRRRRRPRRDGGRLRRRRRRTHRDRHRLPLVRDAGRPLRQVPRPQGAHLGRHLVPAARVQRAPDRAHRRPAPDRAVELHDQRLHRRDAAGSLARPELLAVRLHPPLRARPHGRRPASGSSRGTSATSARTSPGPTTTAAGTPTRSSSAGPRRRRTDP